MVLEGPLDVLGCIHTNWAEAFVSMGDDHIVVVVYLVKYPSLKFV
jgi:hypothetical protein